MALGKWILSQIIENSDNRGSDKSGSMVFILVWPSEKPLQGHNEYFARTGIHLDV